MQLTLDDPLRYKARATRAHPTQPEATRLAAHNQQTKTSTD